jgi:ATP-dependent exoDNAse (exonuclease V) alpha subunit
MHMCVLRVRADCVNEQCDLLNGERLAALLAQPMAQSVVHTSVDSVEADKETVEEEVAAGRDEAAVVAALEEELWHHHFREHDRSQPDTRLEARYDDVHTYAVGAQVMLTHNEPPGGFVNGDIGNVVALRQPTAEELAEREADGRPLEVCCHQHQTRPVRLCASVFLCACVRCAAAGGRGVPSLPARALPPR